MYQRTYIDRLLTTPVTPTTSVTSSSSSNPTERTGATLLKTPPLPGAKAALKLDKVADVKAVLKDQLDAIAGALAQLKEVQNAMILATTQLVIAQDVDASIFLGPGAAGRTLRACRHKPKELAAANSVAERFLDETQKMLYANVVKKLMDWDDKHVGLRLDQRGDKPRLLTETEEERLECKHQGQKILVQALIGEYKKAIAQYDKAIEELDRINSIVTLAKKARGKRREDFLPEYRLEDLPERWAKVAAPGEGLPLTAGSMVNKLREMRKSTYHQMRAFSGYVDYADACIYQIYARKKSNQAQRLRENLQNNSPQDADEVERIKKIDETKRRIEIDEKMKATLSDKSFGSYAACMDACRSTDGKLNAAFGTMRFFMENNDVNDLVNLVVGEKIPSMMGDAVKSFLGLTGTDSNFNVIDDAGDACDVGFEENRRITDLIRNNTPDPADKQEKSIALLRDCARRIESALKISTGMLDAIELVLGVDLRARTNLPEKQIQRYGGVRDLARREVNDKSLQYAQAKAWIMNALYAQHAASHAANHPDLHIMKSQLQLDFNRLTHLYFWCASTVDKHDLENFVPRKVLYRVLESLGQEVELVARQQADLAQGFRDKGDPATADLEACMDECTQALEALKPRVESMLGEVVSQGVMSDKPAAARTWLDKKLPRQVFASGDVEADMANPKGEAHALKGEPGTPGEEGAGASDSDDGPEDATASGNAGAAGAQTRQEREAALERAIKEADAKEVNAVSRFTAWQTESNAHRDRGQRRTDRLCTPAGAADPRAVPPYLIEKDFERAAGQQTRMAAARTHIVGLYQAALDLMDELHPEHDHPRRDEFIEAQTSHRDAAEACREVARGLLEQGQRCRIEATRAVVVARPKDVWHEYLLRNDEVESIRQEIPTNREVVRPYNRIVRYVTNADNTPKLDADGQQAKGYFEDYHITLKGGAKYVVHFHFKTADSDEIVSSHYKTFAGRFDTDARLERQGHTGADAKTYRSDADEKTRYHSRALSRATPQTWGATRKAVIDAMDSEYPLTNLRALALA